MADSSDGCGEKKEDNARPKRLKANYAKGCLVVPFMSDAVLDGESDGDGTEKGALARKSLTFQLSMPLPPAPVDQSKKVPVIIAAEEDHVKQIDQSQQPMPTPEIEAVENHNIKAAFESNDASPFLYKIPPEIRAKIYQDTLGEHLIHVKFVPDDTEYLVTGTELGSQEVGKYSRMICDVAAMLDREHELTGILDSMSADPERWHDRKEALKIYKDNMLIPQSSIPLAILYTSKQIYAEAGQIFYSKTVFSFNDSLSFQIWMKNRTPDQKACIKRLRLAMDLAKNGCEESPDGWNKCMSLSTIGSLSSLQHLHLTMNFSKRPKRHELFSEGRRLRHDHAFGTVSNLSTLPLQHVDVFVRSMRKRTRRYTDLSDQNAKGWNEGDRAEFAEGFKQYLVDSK